MIWFGVGEPKAIQRGIGEAASAMTMNRTGGGARWLAGALGVYSEIAAAAALAGDQPPEAEDGQDQRNVAVALAEVRPDRAVGEQVGGEVAEGADDQDAGQLDAAGDDGDAAGAVAEGEAMVATM